MRERASEVNRIQKALEGANLKLGHVASNVVGVSGREMLRAIVEGSDDPRLLASFARGRMRAKADALVEVLTGAVGVHQRFMLKQQLRHVDELDALIREVEEELDARMRPFAALVERLTSIPGVGPRTAQTLLAEVGTDVPHFPTAKHHASWAGLCPGQEESAGRNRSSRTRQGSPWLRSALVQSAHACARSKSGLGERYRRLSGTRGKRKAALATAHAIIVIAFAVIRDGETYDDTRARSRPEPGLAAAYARKLNKLGFNVTIKLAA